MTLKSSEIQDYSWRISTLLKSFLVSSSSCHACCSSTCRQTNEDNMGNISEIVFSYPAFNCSIIFSMYLFSMRKTMDRFLRYIVIGEWIFAWFNIGPTFLKRKCSWSRTDKFSSSWLFFNLWSACKILRIQFNRIFFELNFWNFLLIVVQIHHKLV